MTHPRREMSRRESVTDGGFGLIVILIYYSPYIFSHQTSPLQQADNSEQANKTFWHDIIGELIIYWIHPNQKVYNFN